MLLKRQLRCQSRKLKDENISSMISPFRGAHASVQDIMKMYSMHGYGLDPSMFGGSETLVLNANNAFGSIYL